MIEVILTVSSIIFFLVFIFLWYSYLSERTIFYLNFWKIWKSLFTRRRLVAIILNYLVLN